MGAHISEIPQLPQFKSSAELFKFISDNVHSPMAGENQAAAQRVGKGIPVYGHFISTNGVHERTFWRQGKDGEYVSTEALNFFRAYQFLLDTAVSDDPVNSELAKKELEKFWGAVIYEVDEE